MGLLLTVVVGFGFKLYHRLRYQPQINKRIIMLTVDVQIQTTKTLIKFCEDHDYQSPFLDDMRSCLKALQQGKIAVALAAFKKVPLGGMGCFNDWLPPTKFPNETSTYVSDLFNILVGHWNLMMQRLPDKA
jgi:hypothetical protein